MFVQSSSLSRRLAAAAAVFCVLGGAAYGQAKLDVPYVPTPQAVVDKMLEMAQVRGDDFLIDLGSGDGRIPITAAAKYGTRGFGVDIDPRRIAEANENATKAGQTERVTFRQQNLFDTKIGEASVLTMYLLQSVNLKLKPRILKELRPGSRVVSHDFHLGDWEPDQRHRLAGSDIFLWIVPANVHGRWRMQDGERAFDLRLSQKYQRVSGTALLGGRHRALERITLRGEAISFVLNTGDGRKLFHGRIAGNVIEPVQAGSSDAADTTAAIRPGAIRRAEGWRASRI